jgi:flagellar motor switch protein FliG
LAEHQSWENIGGTQKAAIVLLALGKQAASEVIKGLNDAEVEKIASEMARLGAVPHSVQEKVLAEFTGAMASGPRAGVGGVEKATELLESALGKSKASEIVTKVRRKSATGALSKLEDMNPAMVAELLKGEHPQTIALIVAQLEPKSAAGTLAALPEELRGDISLRIATMEEISPNTTREIERILASTLEGMGSADMATAGGIKILADILNQGDRAMENEVLGQIEMKDSAVATQVKQLMFVFDDILLLDDRAMQRVLREVDTKDLAIALKGADEDVKQKIFKNISERAAAMIQEEIDYMGPKRLSEVEAAQQAIIEVIRSLEESAEIIIPGRGGASDDIIV